ncbi:hypothetical protein ACFL2Q_01170 [Thermodesulfobacteriota bacterium]
MRLSLPAAILVIALIAGSSAFGKQVTCISFSEDELRRIAEVHAVQPEDVLSKDLIGKFLGKHYKKNDGDLKPRKNDANRFLHFFVDNLEGVITGTGAREELEFLVIISPASAGTEGTLCYWVYGTMRQPDFDRPHSPRMTPIDKDYSTALQEYAHNLMRALKHYLVSGEE